MADVFVVQIVTIVWTATIVLVVIWTEHRKVMALIEKGLYQQSKSGPRGQRALIWGLILTGAGIALAISAAPLSNANLLLSGLLGVGVGTALLTYSLIVKRQKPTE